MAFGRDDGVYDCEVNKGSMNMASLTDRLNARWEDGWELDQVVTSGEESTVFIFRRRETRAEV